jgi:hypothetical protein
MLSVDVAMSPSISTDPNRVPTNHIAADPRMPATTLATKTLKI